MIIKDGQTRQEIVSLEDTPYYHCCSRVVRKAFLCGVDNSTGDNFEHRREWVDSRILELATIFAIDICAYALFLAGREQPLACGVKG